MTSSSSTLSLSATSSVSSSTETASSTSSGPSTTNQGNLYLFTFLSTLLASIIALNASMADSSISLIIGLANHLLLYRLQVIRPSEKISASISRGACCGTRPKFYETWLSDADKYSTWTDLMPVSVLTARSKKKTREPESIRAPVDSRSEAILQRLFASYFIQRDSRFPFRRRRQATIFDTDSTNPPSPRTPSSLGDPGSTPIQEKGNPFSTPATQKTPVQVAVLVAMPSPRRLSTIPSQDEPLPEVVFGITRLNCRGIQPDS
ncbi:hypothetical protein EV360DRAFT_78452 [Lentinula raphanica]|nr:hypothetical protein EV360DRAFT_78452 [Lentinula raphanica]